jgi:hypothetical protein
MKSTISSIFVCITMTLAAPAAIVINFAEVGNDVVATGSGTANLTGLSLLFSFTNAQINLDASSGNFRGGAPGGLFDIYTTLSGPGNFGPGSGTANLPTSGSGDYFGLTAFNNRLFLPGGYVSGTPLSNTSIWTNRTFASLGLAPAGNTFTYTWGSGANADSLTIVTVVPEPSSALLFTLGAALIPLLQRKRTALPD